MIQLTSFIWDIIERRLFFLLYFSSPLSLFDELLPMPWHSYIRGTYSFIYAHLQVRHVILLLCQFVNNIEVIRLPVYHPSRQEKDDPKVYANNVRKLMASEVCTQKKKLMRRFCYFFNKFHYYYCSWWWWCYHINISVSCEYGCS